MDSQAAIVKTEILPAGEPPMPAFACGIAPALREQMTRAVDTWLKRTPSPHTRRAYESDLGQFLAHAEIEAGAWEQLAAIRPEHIADWRDRLAAGGMTNSSIRRKMTALRSLFSYLKTYGYTGANPAHSDFVAAPKVPRDGETVAPLVCIAFGYVPFIIFDFFRRSSSRTLWTDV